MVVFVGVYGNILDAQGAKGILDSSGSSDDDDDDEPQDEKSRLLKKKKEVSEMLRNNNLCLSEELLKKPRSKGTIKTSHTQKQKCC